MAVSILPVPTTARAGLQSVVSKNQNNFNQRRLDDLRSGHPGCCVFGLLSKNGKLTTAGLAAEIGITAKAVEKHLAKLKAEGIIEREGPDKGGSWKVK